VCHVLIVEDEPKIAAFMQKGLGQAGYRAAIANDGPTALAEVATDDYQLILLDLGLPGLDGQEVLRSLRSQGNTCPVQLQRTVAKALPHGDQPHSTAIANTLSFLRDRGVLD
jgi:CheY-like chemotaxis protein